MASRNVACWLFLQGAAPAGAAAGAVSREDAAAVLVGALAPPAGGRRELALLGGAGGVGGAGGAPVREQLRGLLGADGLQA